MRIFGIDVSNWNSGLDIASAKEEGVSFAILRAAYHTEEDESFQRFYGACKSEALPVGAYLYSTAGSREDALEEAEALIRILRYKQFEYPIYMDVESQAMTGLTKEQVDDIVTAFCTTLEQAGYFTGFYCDTYWYYNRMNGDRLARRFTHWRAQWSRSKPAGVDMWQFGSETNYIRSNRIAGQVIDQDYCFRDFPSVIKRAGLNGFGRPDDGGDSPDPDEELIGKLAKINPGAVYGGLTSARGTRVPSFAIGVEYRIVQIAVHYGVREALLAGINSWVALSMLTIESGAGKEKS